MTDRTKTSKTRQQLRDLSRQLISKIELLMAERGPLVKGMLQSHGTRCGKPNCKCMRGELHQTALLVVSQKGKRRNIYVPASDRPELKRRSARYRKLRQARADIVKLSEEILKLADFLVDSLCEPYMPEPRKSRKRNGKEGEKRPRRSSPPMSTDED